MFTPQEVSEKTFPKSSSFSSGYDLAAVDEFLDTLTEDYTALYKENAALKAKLKILAEKLEEYRATEDTMRSMLLAAQKMAASMTDEAKEKSEKMLAEARSQREQILEEAQNAAAVANRDFQQKTEAARQKLSAAEEAMKDYVAKSLALCRTQTQFLLVGWVPARKARELCDRLQEVGELEVSYEHPERDTHHTPPVLLRNLRLFRPFTAPAAWRGERLASAGRSGVSGEAC